MRKQFFILLLFIPLLQSCFELREELYIHKEGWGNYKLVADFSVHKEMLQSLVNQADTSKHNPFGKPGGSFLELMDAWDLGAEKLNNINGIKNARQVFDEQKFIIGLQFDFQDISALNLVLTLKDGGEFNPEFNLPYSYQKGKLNKHNVFVFQKLLKYLNQSNNKEVSFNNQKKAIFAQISYKSIIKTSGRVKRFDNHDFELQESERELHGTFLLQEVLNGAVDISTLIKFK